MTGSACNALDVASSRPEAALQSTRYKDFIFYILYYYISIKWGVRGEHVPGCASMRGRRMTGSALPARNVVDEGGSAGYLL